MSEAKTFMTSVTLEIDGISDVLRPVRFRVVEKLGKPRTIEVECADAPERLHDALRKGAQLDVLVDNEAVRRFEGIVVRVREAYRLRGGTQVPTTTLTIASPLDLLGLTTDCRIFQDMTVPEIVAKVLDEYGIPKDRIATRLTGSYPKLASCTQFKETTLAFVTRLLETAGAFYFFEDGDSGLMIVLGDSPTAHNPIKPATLPFRPDSGVEFLDAAVKSITEWNALRVSKVTLNDLDWQKPDLDLKGSAENKSAGARELYEHPGGYVDAAYGKDLAALRLEAHVANAAGVRGVARAPAMSAGSTFTLEDSPVETLDIEYLITEIEHTWAVPHAVETKFSAIPKTVPFRPLPTVPKPRISGPHTAIVTGAAGQEITTEEHARVRLKFPWDRHAQFDDKSSPWVRVAQVAMSGSMAIPRVGWEVLVEFENGDPDRPIVVGRLYNATYLPPYQLKAKMTVSTLMSYSSPNGAGHNEIRLEDAAGSEHIHMHAQKDMTLKVANDRKTEITTSRMVTIKADEAVTVKGNRSVEIKGQSQLTVAGNQTLTVEGARTKTVKKDEKTSVVGDRTVTITGAHAIATDANGTISTEGNVEETVGAAFEESTEEALLVAIGDDCSVTIGGAKSEVAKKGKTETIDGNRSATVGGALSATSGGDRSVLVKGKHSATVGAAWSVTAGGDIALASKDALEMTIGAALSMTGASGIAFKVGSSKILIGQGGVIIDAPKVKVTSDGPAAIMGAAVGSK